MPKFNEKTHRSPCCDAFVRIVFVSTNTVSGEQTVYRCGDNTCMKLHVHQYSEEDFHRDHPGLMVRKLLT